MVLFLLVFVVWFLNLVFYIGKLFDIVCKLRIVLFVVLYIIIIVVLLIKMNCLIKIFFVFKQYCFFSNCWYGFLMCVLIFVQIGLSVFYFLVFLLRVIYDYSVVGVLFMLCEYNLVVDLVLLGYDLFFVMICLYFVYKLCNLLRVYNEFKWICFSMFINFLLWIVILICYYMLFYGRESYICVIMVLILGVYLMFFFLFFLKVCVIFFWLEKNMKQVVIESIRCYLIDQVFGIDLLLIQGMILRWNILLVCLVFQFMNGFMNKLLVVK